MSKTKLKVKSKRKTALKVSLIIVSILAVLGIVAFFVVGKLLKTEEVYKFGFSGVVYSDGEPLEGAKVDCGAMSAITDENGYYSFTGIQDIVEVSASKDGYYFPSKLVIVDRDTENVDFNGFEEFSLSGVVRNGNEVISQAKIVASSKKGVYETLSNDFGTFSLQNLAGQVTLTAVKENMQLFTQVFDKSKVGSDLVVTGTTTISGKIIADSETDFDFELKLNDEVVKLNADQSFSISGVKPDSILTLTSENFHIDNSTRQITIENDEIIFNAYKYFDLSGKVVSGKQPVEGVRVVVDKTAIKTESNGEFNFTNLFGKQEINCYLQGFEFDSVEATFNNCTNLIVRSTLTVGGKVTTDDNRPNGIEISCGERKTTTNNLGVYTLSGVVLGDIVKVNSNDYYVVSNSKTVNDTNDINFTLRKYFTLSVELTYDGNPLNGGKVIINSKSYEIGSDSNTISIDKLYGSVSVTINVDGYKFVSTYTADYLHTRLSATPYKIYTLSGTVRSGDVSILNATIKLGNNDYTVSDGTFSIDGLYLSGELKVIAEDYNDLTASYSIKNSQLDLNLSYNVTGYVSTKDVAVEGASISVDEKSTSSNSIGQFSFSNLYGTKTINVSKEFYTFTSTTTTKGGEFDFDGTYYISGTAKKKSDSGMVGVECLNVMLVLVNDEAHSELTQVTDDGGNFRFDNLSGRYLLYFDTDFKEVQLLPSEYNISGGGVYNFADNGYKIKGRVTTGDIPVAGVRVQAGDLYTTTDSDGYYGFDLLITETTLVLSKNGYTFDNNNFVVNSEFDKRDDVNFTCSYSISGHFTSGQQKLSGVNVSVNEQSVTSGEDGSYIISGIVGKVNLFASLDSYKFVGNSEISGYGVYDFVGVFDLQITLLSGDVAVKGVSVTHNKDNVSTSVDGIANVQNIQLGDSIYFKKENYKIDSITLNSLTTETTVNCTYSMHGKVQIVNKTLDGVKVSYQKGESQIDTITNENGEFSFADIEGKITLTFEKENYEFDSVEVSNADELLVKAKFSVSGIIKVVGKPLSDVNVSAGNNRTTTNEYGHFEISGLTDSTTIVFEKEGYSFFGDFYVDEPKTFNITANYTISGVVKSGELLIGGADVRLSNGQSTKSLQDGSFTIADIEEGVNITISADGYDNFEISNISDLSANLQANLTYTLVINLLDIVGLKDITIGVNGVENNYSTQSITLEKLSGTSTITLKKDGYVFIPNRFAVTKNTTKSISIKQEYKISGKILTTSGYAVVNAKITAGGKEATTGSDGSFEITGLYDKCYVKLDMSIKDTAYNGNDFNYIKDLKETTTNATIEYKVPDDTYMYFLFKKAYDNLNKANFYQIYGKGTVEVKTFIKTVKQDTRMVYKKDDDGNRIFLNFNKGDRIKLGSIDVDPNVAHFTFANVNLDSAKVLTVRGESKIKSTDLQQIDLGNVSWKDETYGNSISNYGVNPEGYFPYVIKENYLSVSDISVVNGGYQFTFNLDVKNFAEIYSTYTKQMAFMCADQQFKEFQSCALTFTLDSNFNILTLVIHEVYLVTSTGVEGTVTDDFTYDYFINQSNDKVKVDSADEIKDTIKQTKERTVKINSFKPLDIILDDKRRVA